MFRIAAFALALVLLAGNAPVQAQLDPALTYAPQHAPAEFEPSPSAAARGGDEADLVWRWTNDPRWMSGASFPSGEVFFSSITRGRNLAGSTIGPDGDVSIEIVLSTEETTLAQVFRRDQGWAAAGVGTFPGAVYDVSDPDDPRRLNVNITEDANRAPPNMTWDPTAADDGAREYLWVMASDYDGTGTTYADVNIGTQANDLDILYVWQGRLEPGRAFFETDPATLAISLARIADFAAEPGHGEVTLTWNYAAPPEAAGIVIYQGTTSPASEQIAVLAPGETAYSVAVLDPADGDYFRAEAVDGEGNVLDVSTEIRARPLALNMRLLGTLNPSSSYGDIWGYVDPGTGREYALLCARYDGLYVIDVTDGTPVQVGYVQGVEDSKDVKTYGRYAYLVNEYAPIQIIDLADPTDPVQVGTLDVQPGVNGGGSHNILIEGDYLYVVGGRSPGGLRIYSLADPVNPAFTGAFQPTYYHDVEVRNDTLYAAAIYNEGVDILDVSDKTSPSLISTFTYAASTYMGAHNVCSTEDGAYIFVGDEIGSEPHTRVFDVRDPFNVEQVADIVVNPDAPVHNCYVKDGLLYVAHYSEGTRVFDVTDPESPAAVAFYDTYTGPQTGFVGNWTAYPYLPSGKIISSDMQSGLFVLELDLTSTPAEPDGVAPAAGFALDAAYPNPSTGSISVPFLLSEAGRVRLTVFDVLGREVAVLADEFRSAGRHTIGFDGSNLPSGAYFYKLEVEGASSPQTRSLTILR